MRGNHLLLRFILISVLCSAALLVALAGCGGGGGVMNPPPPPGQKIQHLVIIFQENRTPDNLFHGLPNADIANSGVNSLGQTIPLTPIALANDYHLSHAHSAFVAMYDGGKMDGADKIPVGCKAGAIGCPPANPQFQYVNPAEVRLTSRWPKRTLSATACFRPIRESFMDRTVAW